ncbi:MAG: ABC transporter ATP-binding protein [Actinobacteria bacterium]|nr:ABC transporter ATP-binding protein [Actinomycetota bacterium]
MLALESVVGGYGETTVLRDISLTVPEASVVALLGANGAGKTTVMRVASGELRPRAGRVVMDGQDISTAPPFRRWKLGVCHIPEGRAVFPGLTVRENLVTFAKAGADEALTRATEAFPVLAQRMAQRAGTLSGGEQQMLALARAYVTQPRVVLLDEVSMGLAPKVVDDIFAFIGLLARTGASLLLVEQYVSRALELADHVYVMSRGRVTFSGPPAELDEENVLAGYLGNGGAR